MKNQYNNLEKILEKGSCVVVKSGNFYCSILNHKDRDGNYRNSGWCDSIEKSKQYIGYRFGDSKKTWDDIDLEIVEVFRPEFEPFKVGDKVRILDSIKKTKGWEDFKDAFPNMTGEIERVFFERLGTNYLINGWYIGHEYLIPLIEDDEVEKAIKLLEERGRLKDGKILS